MAAAHAAASRSNNKKQGVESTAFGNLVKGNAPKKFKTFREVVEANKRNNGPKDSVPYQSEVKRLYDTPASQIGVAGLIFANFIVSAAQKQIMPISDPEPWTFFMINEWFFGLIFTVELMVNMYGSWPCLFWKSGWNWFDFIIVIISLLALLVPELPGISVLRLFRAFRVFRLFKRIESLKLIIDGVMASLPGVFNAFLVLGILMGIWSIMGVEFFGEISEEEFGTFMKGMFSMWQITTMDSWASGIARPIIYGLKTGQEPLPFAAVYFISFVFVAGVIMTNVVVAILLEKYLEATSNSAAEKAAAKPPSPEEAMKNSENELELLQRLLRMRVVQQCPVKLKEFRTRVKLKEDELAKFEETYLATLELPPLAGPNAKFRGLVSKGISAGLRRRPSDIDRAVAENLMAESKTKKSESMTKPVGRAWAVSSNKVVPEGETRPSPSQGAESPDTQGEP